jgi:hypothetical protein
MYLQVPLRYPRNTIAELLVNIPQLLLYTDEINLEQPALRTFPNVMEFGLNVLAPVMQDMVLDDMAALLSTISSSALTSVSKSSPIRQANQTPWQAAAEAAIYSASHDDSVTTFCLEDCQVIGLLDRKYIIPLVLFLSTGLPTMSLSLKPTRHGCCPLLPSEKVTPQCLVPATYLKIRFIAFMCSSLGFSMNLLA